MYRTFWHCWCGSVLYLCVSAPPYVHSPSSRWPKEKFSPRTISGHEKKTPLSVTTASPTRDSPPSTFKGITCTLVFMAQISWPPIQLLLIGTSHPFDGIHYGLLVFFRILWWSILSEGNIRLRCFFFKKIRQKEKKSYGQWKFDTLQGVVIKCPHRMGHQPTV